MRKHFEEFNKRDIFAMQESERHIETEGKKPNNVVEEILVAINNSRPRHKNTIL